MGRKVGSGFHPRQLR
ncbi:hypothetical protein CEXT_329071, partial [Caerostris extrusa]